MEMLLQRRPTIDTRRGRTTFGDWSVEGTPFCKTLEDAIRKDPDPSTPENEVKVYGETCFPVGRYELRFKNSPHFGEDTIEILDVPGYTDTLVHGGTDIGSTLGCVIVGDVIDVVNGTISGAKVHGILEALKHVLRVAFRRHERVFLTVRDPNEVA